MTNLHIFQKAGNKINELVDFCGRSADTQYVNIAVQLRAVSLYGV